MEKSLKISEQFLNDTGRMAKVGGWEVDAETLEVSWTDETYRIHEVLVGEKPTLEEAIHFFHPDDQPKLEQAIQKALDHGEPYDMDIRFITANGNHLWVRTICRPQIEDGKAIRLMGVFQNITKLKNAEEEREKLISELREALDEIQMLRGVIPICSNCKKIRDEEGYWNQIEEYIQAHSEAHFSHGICQDCAKELYPGLDLYDG